MATIAYYVAWALVEEILKFTGVKLALSMRRLIIPSLLWFFLFEVIFKVEYLTKGLPVTKDEIIPMYAVASFLAGSTSMIHIYTSVYFKYSKNGFFALFISTLLHAGYNLYIHYYMLNEWDFGVIAYSAWAATTIIAMALFLALKFERRFVPTLES